MNLRDPGRPWISTGEGSGLWTTHYDDGKRFVLHAQWKAYRALVELERVVLVPPIKRTMLTIIAATMESVSLCEWMNC